VEALELADYRAAVARLYLSDAGLAEFRERRDALFAKHPQSPIPPGERAWFAGLRYFPPADDAIVEVTVRDRPGTIDIDTGGPDGVVHYRPAGVLENNGAPQPSTAVCATGTPVRSSTVVRTARCRQ